MTAEVQKTTEDFLDRATLARNAARREELDADLETMPAKLDAARAAVGSAFAKGQPTAAADAQLAALEKRGTALGFARTALDQEEVALRDAAAGLHIGALRAELRATVGPYGALARDLDAAADTFLDALDAVVSVGHHASSVAHALKSDSRSSYALDDVLAYWVTLRLSSVLGRQFKIPNIPVDASAARVVEQRLAFLAENDPQNLGIVSPAPSDDTQPTEPETV